MKITNKIKYNETFSDRQKKIATKTILENLIKKAEMDGYDNREIMSLYPEFIKFAETCAVEMDNLAKLDSAFRNVREEV